MKRIYMDDLVHWMNRKNRKPLLIWGARQTGKSFLVKDLFAETYYKDSYIYTDCMTDTRFDRYCEEHRKVDDVINYLSLANNRVINEHTLLIFDEAQECLPVITMMKYFCQEHPEIPVIVTGSMVWIRIKRASHKRGEGESSGFMFPVGKINELTVYPMNFREYLMNKNQILYQTILEAYEKKEPLEDSIHNLAIDEFHNYLLVGGMPEALNTYLETGSYQEAREVLSELYNNYLDDMELYQASPESIVRSRAIFQNIFSQLNKERKSFSPSLIEKGARNRDMLSPIDWLTLANIVEKCSILKERVTIPLMETESSCFRLYLSDIGMFSYESGINGTSFIDRNTRNTLSGIFYENYVANELTAAGIPLYYWKGKNNAEFEFIVQDSDNIIPIDVKKSRGTLNSLKKFSEHNRLNLAVKISENKEGFNKENKVLTIPFYEVFLLCSDLKEGKLSARFLN